MKNPPCVNRVGTRSDLTAKDTSKHPSTPLCYQKADAVAVVRLKQGSTRFDLMFGRFRVLVSVSAAFPISPTDGEVVYNFRGTLDTANFLGQLFRTFSEVLNLGNRQSESTGTGKLYLTFKNR